MSMLDFDLERMVVEQVIRTSGRKIELMFEYASTKTLRNMVTLGYRALHFSGHGSPDSLAFEDDRGGLHVVPVRQLKSLCAAGKKGVSENAKGLLFGAKRELVDDTLREQNIFRRQSARHS